MRVFVRVCVCACALAAAPRVVAAAPVLPGGGRCASDAANCALLEIEPVSTTLQGQFTFDNDVALFQFVLGEGTFNFTAATTSANTIFDDVLQATGFDPILTLYRDGVQFTYLDADDQPVPAMALSPDFDVDAAFPTLVLTGNAEYTLAVTQFGNFPREPIPTLQTGFDQDSFPCFTVDLSEECPAGTGGMFESLFRADLPGLAPQTGHFAIALTIEPVDVTPVPEPGTLSLLALGAAGAALARRRRARHEPR